MRRTSLVFWLGSCKKIVVKKYWNLVEIWPFEVTYDDLDNSTKKLFHGDYIVFCLLKFIFKKKYNKFTQKLTLLDEKCMVFPQFKQKWPWSLQMCSQNCKLTRLIEESWTPERPFSANTVLRLSLLKFDSQHLKWCSLKDYDFLMFRVHLNFVTTRTWIFFST